MSPLRGIPETVLVAPEAFKGTWSAAEVVRALAAGLAAGGRPVDECPVADGGEGTLEALLVALGGELVSADVHDPRGQTMARSFLLSDRLGVVETAGESAFAAGQLVVAAVEAGAETVWVGTGASAIADGGGGAIEAIEQGGGLRGARLVVLCDRYPRSVPMTGVGVGAGAAGGLAGALASAFGAELVAGAGFVLDAVGFDARMRAARAVITGEGTLDSRSLAGKAVSEVATRARQSGVPCHAVVGSRSLDDMGARVLDLDRIIVASMLEEIEAAGRALADEL